MYSLMVCTLMVCLTARTALIFDSQNPEISELSTAHTYKYKIKRQAKIEQRQKKFFC